MSTETLIVFPPFRLDLRNQQLWQGNTLVPLRPKPYAVLAYLVQHAGELVSREELVKAVWPDTYVSESLLRGYIREVRVALADDAEAPRFIETVARRGYRFLAEVASGQQAAVSGQEENQKAKGKSQEAKISDLLPAPSLQYLAPTLVGREAELSQLHRWLAKALQGTRQVVFVSGEAGIGKTTLVDTFLRGAGNWALGSGVLPSPDPKSQSLEPVPRIARGQCIEHYGSGEAYLPVLEALGQLCRQPDGEQIVTLLSRYAPTWLVQMPALVSDDELDALQRKVQGATRERMLREMAEALEALSAERLLVLVLEDVHWSDHSTLDLLSLLAQRRGPARLFVLATYRPADVVVSRHPLRSLKQELQARGHCEEVALGFLTLMEVHQYLQRRFPEHEFPTDLGRIIHQSTEGNPLFMVNVVDEWLRQQVLSESNGHWELKAKVQELAAGVPESLRQMIERQLERLTVDEQRVLETASVVGTEFVTATVAAGLNEQTYQVETWCEGLAKRGQFLQSRAPERLADGTLTGRYSFLHALYPHVLYERLGTLHRVQLHRRIGEWEEETYSAQATEHAAQLALHFERGQRHERAVHYCYEAGQQARDRFATAEATQHFRHGLALLAHVPETQERARQELSLLIALGMALWATASELEAVYTRAIALARELGLLSQHFIALDGLVRWHFLRGEFPRAKELSEQALSLALDLNDPVPQVKALAIMATVLFHCGTLQEAFERTSDVVTRYDATVAQMTSTQYGQDPKAAALCVHALASWMLGYPAQASQQSLAALQRAQEQRSPFEIVLSQCFVTIIQQCVGAVGSAVDEQAEVGITTANEHGSHLWEGIGRTVWGWRLLMQGRQEAGWKQLESAEHVLRATEGKMFRAYTLVLLADAHRQSQQVEAGLTVVSAALAHIEQTGERFWEAELYRIKGELTQEIKNQKSKVKGQKSKRGSGNWELGSGFLSSPSPDPQAQSPEPAFAAEECFLKAIAIARQQQAKSLELRATMSLVRFRRRQAEHATWDTQHVSRDNLAQAHSMLSRIYNWFTEGLETKDLQEAKVLLEDLGN